MVWMTGDLVWVPWSALAWVPGIVLMIWGRDMYRVQLNVLHFPVRNRKGGQLVARDPAKAGADCPSESPVYWSGVSNGVYQKGWRDVSRK